jgi:hypothetical protein
MLQNTQLQMLLNNVGIRLSQSSSKHCPIFIVLLVGCPAPDLEGPWIDLAPLRYQLLVDLFVTLGGRSHMDVRRCGLQSLYNIQRRISEFMRCYVLFYDSQEPQNYISPSRVVRAMVQRVIGILAMLSFPAGPHSIDRTPVGNPVPYFADIARTLEASALLS